MIGASLNQYRITASIGTGGMGEAFRARDPRLNRDVAIKVLPKTSTWIQSACTHAFMNKRFLLCLLLLGLFLPKAVADDIDRFVRAEMERQNVPGIAVGVVKKGRIVKAKGYGFANLEHRVPVTPDTVFQSASVGKQFTAAALLLLADEGRLNLDESIDRYFTNAPPAWSDITVRHLLNHTSGIPDYTGTNSVNLRQDYSEEDMVNLAARLPLAFAPGQDWSYSNTGYVLLGMIIQKSSGRFYGDYLQEKIFHPLKMSARVISEADIIPHRAAGYEVVDGALKNQQWVSPSLNTTADGSLYLTLLDLAKWDAALYADTPLSARLRETMWTPARFGDGATTSVKLKGESYGCGWLIDRVFGRRVVRHSGSWQGFKTYFARHLDDQVTVIVLMNCAEGNPVDLGNGVARRVIPALRSQPVADTNGPITTRLRGVLAAAQSGNLKTNGFEFGSTNAAPPRWFRTLPRMVQAFAPTGIPVLLEASEQDGVRRLRYRVAAKPQPVLATMILNRREDIAHLSLEPE